MDYKGIIEKTYELVDTIKNSEEYKSYLEYEKLVLNDKTTQELIKTFNYWKEKYIEASNYTTYYPGFSDIKKHFQEAKLALMNIDLFKTYKIYEKQITTYINEIEFRIKEVLNIKEKHGKIFIR